MAPLQPAVNATLPTHYTNLLLGDGAVVSYEPEYDSIDQILVFFVSSELGWIPGMQGLIVACLFAGTLSTISSALNAMTAVTLEDFIKPYRKWKARKYGRPVYKNDRRDTVVSKVLTCVYGICGTGLGIGAIGLGSLVVLGNTFLGVTGGPILGTFGVGMVYRRANGIGMLCGTLLGFAFALWIAAGAYVYKGVSGEVLAIYRLSFITYGFYSIVVTIVIGILASEVARLIVGKENIKRVDPKLLTKCVRPSHRYEEKPIRDDEEGEDVDAH
ncbi:sodium-coupled monocarboxylate transporter 1-like [Ptychodera flava]|uniref:sodium-coupled monocarboxylate transporter 1-like n=1 Tax=Ptychodera flava TaxID=63121 RepID=UPI003969D7B4